MDNVPRFRPVGPDWTPHERHDGAAEVHIRKVLSVVKPGTYPRITLYRGPGLGQRRGVTHHAGPAVTRLGCRVVPVHCEINGIFPRGAEPLPENLGDLSAAVRKHSCHIGFAQDPDADRLAIVDETGTPLGEEYTIALVAKHLLAKKPGRVVVNLSTTRAVEDVAKEFNSPFKRTKVGEINVADEMRKHGARIGGEGNGGVISPEVHLGRDSLAGIVYVLEMMAETGKSVSQLKAELPRYVMIKGKIKLSGKASGGDYAKKLKETFRGEKIS